jgi:hypothetical protein
VKPDRSANSTVAVRRSASGAAAGNRARRAASFCPQPGQKAKPTETSNWQCAHFIDAS